MADSEERKALPELETTMNVALIAVIFLAVAGIIGAFLQPTEAEIRASQAAPPANNDDHGHAHGDHGHGGHDDHGHGH